MTGAELEQARRALGEAWGLGRQLLSAELGRVLGLGGRDPGESIHDYERGKTRISGPLALAVTALLDGWRPTDLEERLGRSVAPAPAGESTAHGRGALALLMVLVKRAGGEIRVDKHDLADLGLFEELQLVDLPTGELLVRARDNLAEDRKAALAAPSGPERS